MNWKPGLKVFFGIINIKEKKLICYAQPVLKLLNGSKFDWTVKAKQRSIWSLVNVFIKYLWK